MRRALSWTGNVSGFTAVIVVVVVTSAAFALIMPRFLTLPEATAAAVETVPFERIEPTGLESTLAQVRALDASFGDVQASAALDAALCRNLTVSPVATVSLVLGDPSTQALVMAMPVGTASMVAERIAASWSSCMGANSTTDSPSWMPTVSRASSAHGVTAAVWSRGDFVVVSAGKLADAEAIDATLVAALETYQCASIDVPTSDFYENPDIAGDDYQVPTLASVVEVEPIDPVGPDGEGGQPGEVLAAPQPGDTPDPGDDPEIPEDAPDGRVYWPALPEPVERPEIDEPGDAPSEAVTVNIPRDDNIGPGCGWAFSGYPVLHVTGATATEREQMESDAADDLTSQWETWAGSVEDYWAAREDYDEAVEAYRTYASQVDAVAAYWADVVAPLWDQYDEDLTAYEAGVEAERKWREQREAAAAEWDDYIATCTPPSTTEEQTGTTDPSPQPVENVCDESLRPDILDEEAPEVPDEPERPESPEGITAEEITPQN